MHPEAPHFIATGGHDASFTSATNEDGFVIETAVKQALTRNKKGIEIHMDNRTTGRHRRCQLKGKTIKVRLVGAAKLSNLFIY
jgi:phosphatidate phosphatase APP1